ncbi:MAG: helix-turn-helix domain-containing protein [Candidatus Moranbacteria bacterium]|nr:helix-turn-helix domain-containing protein [Candidatus Moranbacteria bacterium]
MDTKKIFRRLGLPKHADDIYESLRKNGPMIASRICDATGLHRPSVYRALSALLYRRFVYVTKTGNRKIYHPTDPGVINTTFSELSDTVARKLAKENIADDLYEQKAIRLLKGFDGIRAAFDDVISHTKRGETFYRYTSERDLDKVNRYLSKDYRILRDRKRLERMVISNPVSGTRKKPRLERFIKYVPPKANLFDQNIIQLVYGDRVSLIDLDAERVIIIENRSLAAFQKIIFRQLYDKLPLP